MRNLAHKYRPGTLDAMYGQPKAIATIRQHVQQGKKQSLLFVGPSGTGKTTAARIFGAGRLCTDGEPGNPCGKCPTCECILYRGGGDLGWLEMDCGQHAGRETATRAAEMLSSSTMWNWTIFLDEIHALSSDAADALLKAVETPGANAQFIGATTDFASVRPALRSRCTIVRFVQLSAAQCFALLRDVCEREAILHETKALDMIASASAGSARDALMKLDEIAWQGPVTPALVAETLAFGTVGPLLTYFDSVIAGDAGGQHSALYSWQAAPAEKARLIRAYLLQIYQSDLATPALGNMVDPAFYEITEADRRRLIAGIAARTGGRPLPDFWLDLLDEWLFDPAQITDDAALAIKVHRFHRMLHGSSIEPTSGAVPVSRKESLPASRRRAAKLPARAAGAGLSDCYLTRAQAEALYDAATMLPQEYGVLFNTSLHLNHAALGDGSEAAARALISSITHELSLRVKTWARGDALHWAYVHQRRDEGIETDLALHIPVPSLPRVEEWLRSRMGQWRSGASRQNAYELEIPKESVACGPAERGVRRHWRVTRRLWRGICPDLLCWGPDGSRAPLAGLLGVPAAHRTSLGNLTELRRYHVSASLGPTQRSAAEAGRMKLLSAFADHAWSSIETGWELREAADRKRERVERADQIERVEVEWQNSRNPIEVQRREEDLARLRESWPVDPHRRVRSWKGWW